MLNSIPVCFYPTRKIILDDDPFFTSTILLKMHNKNMVSYTSPTDALNYLLNEYKPALTALDILQKSSLVADSTSQYILNINIEKLKTMILKPCYQDISIIFIDYHMPDIQGIDFLKQIQHLPIKYVLVTGEKNYNIAIDAFNSGLVDAYIRKDDPSFIEKFQAITSELEWKYFIELSKTIINLPDFNFLMDANVFSSFKQQIQHHSITEFYLTHIDGNFTMINSDNEKIHLLFRNKSQLKRLAEIAREDGGSIEIVNELLLGNIIPFFDSKEYWQIPAADWKTFSYPTNQVLYENNMVWALAR